MRRERTGRSLGVAAGAFAATLLPIVVVPVVGVLTLVRLRRSVSRGLLALLLGAAFVWSLPLLVTVGVERFGISLGQATLVALIAVAAHAAGRQRHRGTGPWVVAGCIAGLAALLGVSVLQRSGMLHVWMSAWAEGSVVPGRWAEHVDPLRWPSRAWGWSMHPNVWSASVATVSFGALIFASRIPWAWFAVVPATLTLLSAGSRAALLAYLLSVTVLGLGDAVRRRAAGHAGVARWAVAAAILLGAAVLVLAVRDDRMGVAIPVATPTSTEGGSAPTNLVRSSERLDDRVVWKPRNVRVAPATGGDGELAASRWSIQKDVGVGGAARLVQRVSLEAGREQVLSLRLSTTPPTAQPSVVLSVPEVDGSLSLDKRLDAWTTEAEGAIELEDATVREDADGWWLVSLRFRVTGSGDVDVLLAFVPDRDPSRDTALVVAAPHLRPSGTSDEYVATLPRDRLRADAARSARIRLDIFGAAWTAFLERPLWGWGEQHLADVQEAEVASRAGHAHNAVLQALWQRGLVGLLGLSLLFGPMLVRGSHVARPAFAVLVLGLNALDYPLWAGGVSYAVAALGGLLMTDSALDASAGRHE